MDATFIKTSQGIIRRESITFIQFTDDRHLRKPTGEKAIKIFFSTSVMSNRLILQGEEAEAFLQMIPIVADFTYLSKPKSELESDGRRD